MPRGIAHDHSEKRAAIRKGAATYFATHGYDRASMTGAAKHCGVSKALIYHYYDSKEALLFDILDSHLTTLVETVEAVETGPDYLRRLIHAILQNYRNADAEHKLQGDALETLPDTMRKPLLALQRRLVEIMGKALQQASPETLTNSTRLRPVTMTVFGMLNWFYMWHRPGKGLSREEYADLVTDMVLNGVKGLPD
jgi:AcrR family transcriptional regulator